MQTPKPRGMLVREKGEYSALLFFDDNILRHSFLK